MSQPDRTPALSPLTAPTILAEIAAQPGLDPVFAAALSEGRLSALCANLRDLRTDMAERFENVSDADFAQVEASLRRLRTAAAMFASLVDGERKALADVVTRDRDGRLQTMAADVMGECTLDLVCDMLGLNSDASAVLGSL